MSNIKFHRTQFVNLAVTLSVMLGSVMIGQLLKLKTTLSIGNILNQSSRKIRTDVTTVSTSYVMIVSS